MCNVFVQVLALGKGKSISNEKEGLGMNPSGGFDGEAVVNNRISPSVIWNCPPPASTLPILASL